MLIFAFLLISFAAAQQDVVQVIRVDEIMPLLNSLVNSGSAKLDGVAERITEIGPTSNVQGSVKKGANMVVEQFQQPLSSIDSIPMFANLLSYINSYTQLKEQPAPTLAPFTPPATAARTFSDLGIATAAAKNTVAAVSALPVETIASGGSAVSDTFQATAKQILGTPAQINHLLRFQHGLMESYLTGFQQGISVVTPEAVIELPDSTATKLKEDLMRLTVIQPRLNDLIRMIDNPQAAGVFQALSEAFDSVRINAIVENSDSSDMIEPLLMDPVTMRVALANIALSFLQSISNIG